MSEALGTLVGDVTTLNVEIPFVLAFVTLAVSGRNLSGLRPFCEADELEVGLEFSFVDAIDVGVADLLDLLGKCVTKGSLGMGGGAGTTPFPADGSGFTTTP